MKVFEQILSLVAALSLFGIIIFRNMLSGMYRKRTGKTDMKFIWDVFSIPNDLSPEEQEIKKLCFASAAILLVSLGLMFLQSLI